MPELFLKPADLQDERVVDGLLDQLTTYSMAAEGVPKTKDGARQFLTAFPPGRASENKYAFLVVHGWEPVGLVDVIDGYPTASVAFIGLLAVNESNQRKGLGRAAYKLVEQFAQDELQAATMRLAVVETNPVVGFWHKMGFRETGEVKPYAGEAKTVNAILMQKSITLGG